MAIVHLNPYLKFLGTCEKAIALYERALDAKVEGLMRWGDAPGPDCGPELKGKIMHSLLRVGPMTLMAADVPASGPGVPASGVLEPGQVCLHLDDVEETQRRFALLSEGGTVIMPLHDSFWGAKFAMCADPFGVRWMFNCEQKKA